MARSTDSNSSGSDAEVTATDAPTPPKDLKAPAPEVPSMQDAATSERKSEPRGRPTRPKIVTRNSSTMIVPRSQANIVAEEEEVYPAGDARAMSPRRNSQETEAIEEATRTVVRE